MILQIKKGEHISSTKGDVTLRGNFHMLNPLGEYEGVYTDEIPIAFYTNHINLTVYINGNAYVIEHENPLFGKSACGKNWSAYAVSNGGNNIEIVVNNPHNFGNDMLLLKRQTRRVCGQSRIRHLLQLLPRDHAELGIRRHDRDHDGCAYHYEPY